MKHKEQDPYLLAVRKAREEYEAEMASHRRVKQDAVNKANRDFTTAQRAAAKREKMKLDLALRDRPAPPSLRHRSLTIFA